MQLFSSFGISFLHFSALTLWQFNFAFSVLHNYVLVFSILKKIKSLQLSLCYSWKAKYLNRTATTTQGPAGSSAHHITFLRFLLEKFYLLSAPCQGWDRWYQNCSWLALISFEIKKKRSWKQWAICETASQTWQLISAWVWPKQVFPLTQSV